MSARALLLGLAAGAGALVVLRLGDAEANVTPIGVTEGQGRGFVDYLPTFLTDAGEQVTAAVSEAIGLGPDAQELGEMSADSNVSAFLQMFRAAEGTDDPLGYQTIVGGETFASFDDHPRVVKSDIFANGKKWRSSAAGAYQVLIGTWDDARRALKLPDFSPESQDQAAVWLIGRRGALNDVRAGRFSAAVSKCAGEWANLAGSARRRHKAHSQSWQDHKKVDHFTWSLESGDNPSLLMQPYSRVDKLFVFRRFQKVLHTPVQ